MAVNLENASLVLNSRDASLSQDANTNWTWTNINLETVLGQMYYKYESFNICLSFVMSEANLVDSGITTVNDRNCLINIGGLPWINQTYNAKTNTNGSQTVIGFVQYPTNTSSSIVSPSFQSFYVATFTKNCPIVNININMKRIDLSLPTATNDFPNMLFLFDIYGVKPLINLLEHRMK